MSQIFTIGCGLIRRLRATIQKAIFFWRLSSFIWESSLKSDLSLGPLHKNISIDLAKTSELCGDLQSCFLSPLKLQQDGNRNEIDSVSVQRMSHIAIWNLTRNSIDQKLLKNKDCSKLVVNESKKIALMQRIECLIRA